MNYSKAEAGRSRRHTDTLSRTSTPGVIDIAAPFDSARVLTCRQTTPPHRLSATERSSLQLTDSLLKGSDADRERLLHRAQLGLTKR